MNQQGTITIEDLEVFYSVGVPDIERSKPQRLLLTIAMNHDFAEAIRGDDLRLTVDYFAVTERLKSLGTGRSWKLIEKLAGDIG